MERPEPAERPLLPYQVVLGLTTASIAGITALLGELNDAYGFGEAATGVVAAAGFLAAFGSQVALAPLADRGRARTMASTGIALSAAALAASAFVSTLAGWIAVRAVLGFAVGLVFPAVRRAAIVLEPERVGENLGRLAVGEVVGFIAGPVLAASLAETFGLRVPFLLLAGALAAFLPLVLRLPSEPGAGANRPPAAPTGPRGVPSSLRLLGRRRLLGALVIVAANFVLVGTIDLVIPLSFSDRGAPAVMTGLAFTLLAIPVAIVGPRAGRWADHVGPVRAALGAVAAGAGLMALFGAPQDLTLLFVALTVFGLVEGVGFLSAQVSVSRSVPSEQQAAALGLLGATELGASGAAAVAAGLLYGRLGEDWTWIATAGIAATLLVVAGALLRGTAPATAAGRDGAAP